MPVPSGHIIPTHIRQLRRASQSINWASVITQTILFLDIMPKFNLYIDVQNNRLLTSKDEPTIVNSQNLPLFYGDTVQVNIWLLQSTTPAQLGSSTYSIVPTQGLSLQLYINDGKLTGGTNYTQQLAWNTDANNQYFYANLALNTANLAALMASSNTTATLVIGYTQNGYPTTVFSGTVNFQVGLPAGANVVPAGLTPISVEVANQTFMPIIPVPGQALALAAADGTVGYITLVKTAGGGIDIQVSQ